MQNPGLFAAILYFAFNEAPSSSSVNINMGMDGHRRYWCEEKGVVLSGGLVEIAYNIFRGDGLMPEAFLYCP